MEVCEVQKDSVHLRSNLTILFVGFVSAFPHLLIKKMVVNQQISQFSVFGNIKTHHALPDAPIYSHEKKCC